MTQDYISVITKVKNSWNTITNKFTSFEVNEDNLPDLISSFEISGRAVKKIKKKINAGQKYQLWDFCMEVFNYFSNKKYKSDVHKRKRLDKFVSKIFDYSLIMEI